MQEAKQKRSGYLQDALQQAADIIFQAKGKKEAVAAIKDLMSKKVLESFKNGIEVGKKKAGTAK